MARCPFALWKPVASHGGPMRSDLGCIEHVTTNHGDPFNFFGNVKNLASSHFWIADDGTLEQYIDTDLASWAQAGGNYQYVSVETSGTPDEPLTDAQGLTFARLYGWGHDTHGWPFQLAERPGQSGLGWHGMGGAAWGGHSACPGELRKAQRAHVLALASASSATPAPPAPTFPEDPEMMFADVPGGRPDSKNRIPVWQTDTAGNLYNWNGAPFLKSLSVFTKDHPPICGIQPIRDGSATGVVLIGDDAKWDPETLNADGSKGSWQRSTYVVATAA